MTVQKAISVYTDKKLAKETIDLDWFYSKMSAVGYRRFVSMIPLMDELVAGHNEALIKKAKEKIWRGKNE